MVDKATREEVDRELEVERQQKDAARRKRLGELRAQAKAESAKRGPNDKNDTPPDVDDKGNLTEAGQLRAPYMGPDYQKHMEAIDREYDESVKAEERRKKKKKLTHAAVMSDD